MTMAVLVVSVACCPDGVSTPIFASPDIQPQDGHVSTDDLLALLAAWGGCEGCCPADLDRNGTVGTDDLIILLSWWGPMDYDAWVAFTCPP